MRIYLKLILLCTILFGIIKPVIARMSIWSHYGNRIGIISLFQGNSGMFYRNRAILYNKHKKRSLFPQKDVKFHIDVNLEISDSLKRSLDFTFPQYTFIKLPSLSPEKYLSGYFIEGWWGNDTKSVSIRQLKPMFQTYALNSIIAIVPVTYHLPLIRSEASGMNLTIIKNEVFFSSTYAILIFVRTDNSYKKTFSSIKQVYYKSFKLEHDISNVTQYNAKHLDTYYLLFKNSFLPHINAQVTGIVKQPMENILYKPKAPLSYYLLPH